MVALVATTVLWLWVLFETFIRQPQWWVRIKTADHEIRVPAKGVVLRNLRRVVDHIVLLVEWHQVDPLAEEP